MTRRRRLGALLVLAGALVATPAAVPYSFAGVPWPGQTVKVWDTSGYGAQVDQALAAWNAVGAGVSLVRARTARDANVTVSLLPSTRGDIAGEANVGWVPGLHAKLTVAAGMSHRAAAVVITHELGHVLGLGHENAACAVMRPEVEMGAEETNGGCAIARCAHIERCLIQPDDARALLQLYRVQRPTLRPDRVAEAVWRRTGITGFPVTHRWRSPVNRPGARILLRAVRGRCPETPYHGTSAVAILLRRGSMQEATLSGLTRGSWCAGLWVQAPETFYVGPATYVRFTVASS